MVYTSETVQGQIYIPAANWTRAFPFHFHGNAMFKDFLSRNPDRRRRWCFQKFDLTYECLWVWEIKTFPNVA